MYGIDGRRDLTESTRDDLSGYAGARPVRIGNGAFDQRQNDVFGAALDSILLHTRRSQRLPRRLWPIVAGAGRVRDRASGASPTRASGRRAASPSTTCRPSSWAGSRWTARPSWPHIARRARAWPPTWGAHRRGDQGRHPRARRRRARRPAPALRDRRPRRLDAARGAVRVPAGRRRAAARQRPGHRGRADRGRLRAALPHRRDRRRAVGQGGHVPDLLVLARLGAGDHRRAPARPRPDGAPAARSPRRWGSTPRSSTPTRAGTWATSRRRSRTSR